MTPSIAVDAVVISRGRVLLVERRNPPFQGCWSFPGGFVEVGERTEEAVVRELHEETGTRARVRGLVGVYSDPKRDPRGHNVAVAYLLTILPGSPRPRGGDDARRARWWPLRELPSLAFDHERILRDARRLASPGGRRSRGSRGRSL